MQYHGKVHTCAVLSSLFPDKGLASELSGLGWWKVPGSLFRRLGVGGSEGLSHLLTSTQLLRQILN